MKPLRRSLIRQIALLCLMGILILAACQETAPAPTATPAPTLAVPDPASATPAPAPTATPAAAATLPSPPTLAAPPTSTPTVEPEATPTDTPILLTGPEDFGDDRNPLTGEVVADPALLQRRPLAIKISNSPPQWVRPQSGLNDADLVFEHITEGFITRFTMIVYGRTPPDVGPVRSARLIDLELPAMYDAALVFSGASVGVSQRLNRADFNSRILYSSAPGYYRTGAAKPYEHTLYADPAQLWGALETRGLNVPPSFTSHMSFSSLPPEGGEPAGAVSINYRWETQEWRFDAESGRYRRWSGGAVHNDGNTGEQVRASNVVIVFATHVEDPSICEEARNGRCVALSVQAQIWGEGPVWILRDGQVFRGRWRRTNRSDMLTFFTADGQPLPLQIGNSWVQVVPSYFTDPVTVTP